MSSHPFQLASWQKEFVDSYLHRAKAKSLLVAPVGSGKTVTSLHLASLLLKQHEIDAALLVTDIGAIRDQWQHAAAQFDLDFSGDVHAVAAGRTSGAVLTSRLQAPQRAAIHEVARAKRLFVLLDESHRAPNAVIQLTDELLASNPGSKALFLTATPIGKISFDAEFRFNTEFMFRRSVLEDPSTEASVSLYSPSFALIRKLQRERVDIDGLSWRDFEKLIASLLNADGYVVELMQGSKDGGVDVIAIKDEGPAGLFKTVWQAKKKASNKVGPSTVRELADTQRELGASKGIIVTSTYLTRGALKRIQRDKYMLGKVDRDDLEAWISRVLYDV